MCIQKNQKRFSLHSTIIFMIRFILQFLARKWMPTKCPRTWFESTYCVDVDLRRACLIFSWWRRDIPLFLSQVAKLQELQQQTSLALQNREEKIRILEKQLSSLQNEYLAVTLQKPLYSHDSKIMLLSCLQTASFALSHGHQMNPTTQLPILHAIDELLQEMVYFRSILKCRLFAH